MLSFAQFISLEAESGMPQRMRRLSPEEKVFA
jgi:hypothetical protein